MMDYKKARLGSPKGSFREGVIYKDNKDGTVDIKLAEGNGLELKNVPYSATWFGPDGQFMGGAPLKNSNVIVSQSANGQWYIVSHFKSNSLFDSYITGNGTLMSSLKNGRALIQVKNGNKVIVDPDDGIHIGDEGNKIQADPALGILSHNFDQEMAFTEASREINSIIKRDLGQNSTRGVLDDLASHKYDKSLYTISMDPTSSGSFTTSGGIVRNLPLVEKREIVYELAGSGEYTNDNDEASKYIDPNSASKQPRVNRRRLRTDTLSLNYEYSNFLMETIKGTSVDFFGNILDLNRDALPIGKVKELSLADSENKKDAFEKIREISRRSIAYHMEINTRKPLEDQLPPENKITDYARSSSNFSIDIDKEGQFKINVPASSEIGNIPLFTRYDNFSNLIAREDNDTLPNSYIRADNNKEIYISSFVNHENISINGDDPLKGFESPIDRITGTQIKLGTVHHDITQVCKFLTTQSPRLPSTKQVHPYSDDSNKMNNASHFTPYNPIVSSSITTYGDSANAGGRSGSINLDGFVSVNIGANTIDRQSLWLDYAGGVVSSIGRDKQGISYAASLDGDLILQVGGAGIGNTYDSRFSDQNDAVRNGTVDVRVIVNNGQQLIFRMSSTGIDIYSPGDINITSQQNINIKAGGTLGLDGVMIQTHATSTKRIINKVGPSI